MKKIFKNLFFFTVVGFFTLISISLAVNNTSSDYFSDLQITPNGRSALVAGRIDTSKFVDWAKSNSKNEFDFVLQYSTDPTIPSDSKILTNKAGIDGSYGGEMTNLINGQKYYIRSKLTIPRTTPSITKELTPVNPSNFDFQSKTTLAYTHIDQGSVLTGKNVSIFEEPYKLLAPWPGLSVIRNPGQCLDQTSGAICDINGLISFIFRLLVGLTAVFMVIRLMFIGYQYMTTDIISHKINARADFLASLSGLVLALSAWLILNTINPKLVSNDFSVDKVRFGILQPDEDLVPLTDYPSAQIPVGSIAGCSEGLEEVSSTTHGYKFYVCKKISTKVRVLLEKSWTDGINLSGGGFRTRSSQIALRAQNCGGNSYVYNEKAPCNPLTAVPGTSRHESGLALDLTCKPTGNTAFKLINIDASSGQAVSLETQKCLDWLKTNASGTLINFSKENWHWSFDGK